MRRPACLDGQDVPLRLGFDKLVWYNEVMSESNVVPIQFISAEEWEERMQALATTAENTGRITVPRATNMSRKEVAETFLQAFQMIGGVPRLAMWANEHETEFFKLFAKLLPSQSLLDIQGSGELVIKHVVPRSPLDELPEKPQ